MMLVTRKLYVHISITHLAINYLYGKAYFIHSIIMPHWAHLAQ